MKAQNVIQRRIAFALALGLMPVLALMLLSASSVLACDPDPDPNAVLRCSYEYVPRPLATPTPTARPAPTITPVPAAPIVARGDSPDTAREPTGNQEYIGPEAKVWYKLETEGLRLTIWVDANNQTGLSLAMYGPDQTDLYGKPVARVTSQSNGHDLFWTGRTRARGAWYALLTNSNSFAVPYSLNSSLTRHKISDLCAACHGNMIEWQQCEGKHRNPNFCSDMQNEYNEPIE
jgi:hypothetical protein